eukprot:TRINITY_DN24737_c0_g1_i1.p1 TRINITY_DN24737_c0_g1~~TRINITY_DN24737_c0_g1_i1.p1  ORF type:complete len:122 (-),score=11.48 TRINITY_DN24737_c0_g1_i1:136-480(-)
MSTLRGGVTVGSGPIANSIRYLIVQVGASATEGRKSIQVSWGVQYADASKLSVDATPLSSSSSVNVYAASVSEISTVGCVVHVMRLDELGAAWDDTALRLSIRVVERLSASSGE